MGILSMGMDTLVPGGPEAYPARVLGVCNGVPWRVWLWELLPGVLDADLAQWGEGTLSLLGLREGPSQLSFYLSPRQERHLLREALAPHSH